MATFDDVPRLKCRPHTPHATEQNHIFGALAEIERNLIRERMYAGLAAARVRGRKGGRRKKLGDKQRAVAVDLYRQKKHAIDEICKAVGISRPTLGEGIPQVVKDAATGPIEVGVPTTVRVGVPPVAPAGHADLGIGQILGPADSHRGIKAIFAVSWHDEAPGRRVLRGITSDNGKAFTDPAPGPCCRPSNMMVYRVNITVWPSYFLVLDVCGVPSRPRYA